MGKQAVTGYTILEVMIFLAVSGAMFIIAITTFSGRQQQVRFTQAVRDLDSRLQDVLNDVSTGYYQSAGRIRECTVVGDGTRPTVAVASGADTPQQLGTDSDCVYVGKVLHFVPEDSDPSTDNATIINVYDVVGRRYKTGTTPPASLAESMTKTVQLPVPIELRSGLKVTAVARVSNPVSNQLGAIGIFTDTNKFVQVGSINNNEGVNSAVLTATTFNNTPAQIYNSIDSIPANTVTGADARVIICLIDTDNKRKASITFGGTERATKVDIDTYNTAVCGP